MKMPCWVSRTLKRRSSADANIEWAKSSFSHVNGNCVEVTGLSTQMIRIRDSKNPEGPALLFTPTEWDAFLDGVRNGEFDRRLGRAA
jgi:hypothetical protein